ncbi:MAG: hypothetical protein LBH04_04610 [Tannerellaceae bacterium]|jgi:hypothetical protein|nr:hypothetical protein [Tannerellaceae bacterium]
MIGNCSLSGIPKAFLPAPGSFRGSEKLPGARKNTFRQPETFPTSGKIFSGFRKASRRQEKCFRAARNFLDARKNVFGLPETFPTPIKILSGFRKFFPMPVKILSGFRKFFPTPVKILSGFRKGFTEPGLKLSCRMIGSAFGTATLRVGVSACVVLRRPVGGHVCPCTGGANISGKPTA